MGQWGPFFHLLFKDYVEFTNQTAFSKFELTRGGSYSTFCLLLPPIEVKIDEVFLHVYTI